jgi:hypothetical protein
MRRKICFWYENDVLDHTNLTVLFTNLSDTCVLRGRRSKLEFEAVSPTFHRNCDGSQG